MGVVFAEGIADPAIALLAIKAVDAFAIQGSAVILVTSRVVVAVGFCVAGLL